MTSRETIEQRYEEAILKFENSGNALQQAKVQMSKSAIELQNTLCKKERDLIVMKSNQKIEKKRNTLLLWEKEEERRLIRKVSVINSERAAKILNLQREFLLFAKQSECTQ